jgi:SAM-dependent methyltransferase
MVQQERETKVQLVEKPKLLPPDASYLDMLFKSGPSAVDPLEPSWRLLKRFAPSGRQAAILDAACGNGRFAFEFCRLGYTNVTGTDLYPSLQTGGKFYYVCASLDALELPDASFDFAYCMSAIYHLEDPADGFRELYRVLRPGALAVLTAHTRCSLFTLERRLRRPQHLHDVTFRSAKEYCKIAKQQGFDLVEVDGFRLIYSPIDSAYAVLYKIAKLAHRGTIPKYVAWPCGRFWKHFRSIFAYHSVIVVRRRG